MVALFAPMALHRLGAAIADEFARQRQAASLSEAKDMAVDQPYQGDPDGLRFAPALTRLIHGQQIST
jgi:putative transposase